MWDIIIGLVVGYILVRITLELVYISIEGTLIVKDTIYLKKWLKNSELKGLGLRVYLVNYDMREIYVTESKYMVLFSKYYIGNLMSDKTYNVIRWSPLHKQIEAKFKELHEKN